MIVKKVLVMDDKVNIILDKGNFIISKENYIENSLAIDSSINQEKIDYLKEYDSVVIAKMQLIKILNKKALSQYEIEKYLIDTKIKNTFVKKIIDSLIRAQLINDEYVSTIVIEGLLRKRKGKLEMIKVLSNRGICDSLIEKSLQSIEEDIYLDNFNKVCNKYLKMYDSKSIKIKEQMIKNKLKEYGYENKYIDNICLKENMESEVELARKSLSKIIKSKRINTSDRENINKMKAKLSMKGFSYDIINIVLKEVVLDETY